MTHTVTREEASELRKQGWKAVDLHVHTTKSHDVFPVASLTPRVLYAKAKGKGMDFVTFTDHDTMAAYAELGELPSLVRGVEIKVFDPRIGHTVHINVYELSDSQFGMLEFLSKQQDLATFIGYCRDENLPHTLNHPHWCEVGEKIRPGVVEELVKLFPVIELNMSRSRKDNNIVEQLAAKYSKGIVAATDTHSGDVGEAYTLAQGETFREFWNNVAAGNAVIVRRDMSMKFIVSEVNARLQNAFSYEYSEDQLRVFANGQKRQSTRVAAKALLYSKKVKPVGLLLKHTLLGISSSRVPALIYVTQGNLRKKN